MKTGLALPDLAAELRRQVETKADYVAPTTRMSVTTTDRVAAASGSSATVLTLDDAATDGGLETFDVGEIAHDQIASHYQIPAKFYDRLRSENGGLYDHLLNGLFAERPARRMIRTLDGKARAFLSDKYRRLDHADVAEAVLPILAEFPDMQIVSCQLTERRLYIKALFPRIEAEVAKGDVVQAGVVISNSEVGAGALAVHPLLFRLICLNGMVAQDYGQRRYHVGKRVEEGEDAFSIYRDETIEADDRAFMMKVADVVRASADQALFEQIVGRCRELADVRVPGPPDQTVERLAATLDLSDQERGSVLEHLTEGGDLSRWGFLNAVTRAAEDVESYDRASELEALGGRLLSLAESDWAKIAVAA